MAETEVESDELRAVRAFLGATGVPHRVTCTLRHRELTAAGFPSIHRAPGTNGRGRAADLAAARAGRDTPELMAVFSAFEAVEPILYELIYAGPEIEYNIKRGKRVTPYAQSGHHDHVHIAVSMGVLLEAVPSIVAAAGAAPIPEPAHDIEEVEEDEMANLPAGTRVGTLPCTVAHCHGWWELCADGAVFTVGGDRVHDGHYFGSILEEWMEEHRLPESRFTALGPRRGGVGYTTWGHDGERQIFYEFGPGIGPVPEEVP